MDPAEGQDNPETPLLVICNGEADDARLELQEE
jgi:hypothetical protein